MDKITWTPDKITWTPIVTGKIAGFADNRFGGSATAFPPLKFQHKMAYSLGK
jgi:hypothetical protein